MDKKIDYDNITHDKHLWEYRYQHVLSENSYSNFNFKSWKLFIASNIWESNSLINNYIVLWSWINQEYNDDECYYDDDVENKLQLVYTYGSDGATPNLCVININVYLSDENDIKKFINKNIPGNVIKY